MRYQQAASKRFRPEAFLLHCGLLQLCSAILDREGSNFPNEESVLRLRKLILISQILLRFRLNLLCPLDYRSLAESSRKDIGIDREKLRQKVQRMIELHIVYILFGALKSAPRFVHYSSITN
jgi:hypothetical protein